MGELVVFEDLPEMVRVLGLLLASSEDEEFFTSGPNTENMSFVLSLSRLDMLSCTSVDTSIA